MSETKARKTHTPLSALVFRTTLMGCIVLGAVALLIGLGFYTGALVKQYIADAFGTTQKAAMSVRHGSDSEGLSRETMRIYRALSEEERAEVGTAAYRDRFSALETGYDYENLVNMLNEHRKSSRVKDIYFAAFDADNGCVVYLADPGGDGETPRALGDWQPIDRRKLERFLSWDGEGMLYHIGRTEQSVWLCTAGVPVVSKSGETYGYVLADVALETVAAGMRAFTLQFTVALLLLTLVVAVIQTRRMQRAVVRPINAIAEAASIYARDKRSGNASGGHFARLNIHTCAETENLGDIMAEMERDLSEYEADLTRAVAEKERIGTELALAAGIQTHMLPSIFPPFPERDEFDIYAAMEPAKEVGGDFYDFFLIGSDRLGMVVADVSGKGVPAALFSMIAKTLLKTKAQTGLSPERVLWEVNAALSENNEEDMFVTVWLGVLELSTGVLTYANAGHEHLALRQNGAWRYLDRSGGAALAMFTPEDFAGMDEKYRFHDRTVQLEAGDAIFQYTDGVTEATDSSDALFGDERLLDALNEAGDAEPEALLARVRAAIDAFVKDAPQFDDITMLALKLN